MALSKSYGIVFCLYKQKNYFSESWLVHPRNYFPNRIPRSNFLLPRFSTGGTWDLQVANLLLATVDSDPGVDMSATFTSKKN